MKLEVGKAYKTVSGLTTSELKIASQYPLTFIGYAQDILCEWYETGEIVTAPHSTELSLVSEAQSSEPVKVKTDKSQTGLTLIPFYPLFRIGAVFIEGKRYDGDDQIPNWKKGVGDNEYQVERLEHALVHLFKWKEGDRSEDHLAKVAWFCMTQMELERLEDLESLDIGNDEFRKALEKL